MYTCKRESVHMRIEHCHSRGWSWWRRWWGTRGRPWNGSSGSSSPLTRPDTGMSANHILYINWRHRAAKTHSIHRLMTSWCKPHLIDLHRLMTSNCKPHYIHEMTTSCCKRHSVYRLITSWCKPHLIDLHRWMTACYKRHSIHRLMASLRFHQSEWYTTQCCTTYIQPDCTYLIHLVSSCLPSSVHVCWMKLNIVSWLEIINVM